MLRPGLAVAWRSPGTLQLGLDGPEPLVVSGLSPACRAALGMMDGTRTVDQVVDQVHTDDHAAVHELVDRLASAGALLDAGLWPGGRGQPPARRERLLPDLVATAPADPDSWWAALATAHVTVFGASRLGAVVARALSESGIAKVEVHDRRPVTAADVCLGGFASADIGSMRSELLRAHPGPPPPPRRRKVERHLAVVTDAVDIDQRAATLAASGTPYLVTSCQERAGTVGPFVDPGSSACHFCLELHRRDEDPAWPELWRQRTWSASPVTVASTVAVTAHLAASQVVSWVLGEPMSSAVGVLQVDGRRGTSVLRPVSPHPECGCAWRPLAS
jgi:hypothetical protein